MTKEVKAALNRKKAAFHSTDTTKMKAAQKDLKRIIRQGKREYSLKLEEKVQDQDSKAVWNSLKLITGCGVTSKSLQEEGITPNEVNTFFAWFDKHDFSNEHAQVSSTLVQRDDDNTCPPITITADQVRLQLKRLNTNKAAGPDGVHPRTLKTCADQLCDVLHYIFSLSLSMSRIPMSWKTSCIVPVPKKTKVYELNDVRPIALTSQIMKCFERTILPY